MRKTMTDSQVETYFTGYQITWRPGHFTHIPKLKNKNKNVKNIHLGYP